MQYRFSYLLVLAGALSISAGCNGVFHIVPGESGTGGAGGTTDTGGTTTTGGTTGETGGTTGGTGGTTGGTGGTAGDTGGITGGTGGTTGGTGGITGGTGGTTGGTGGSPTCGPLSATCEGAILHTCDANGFPEPDVACDAPAACDPLNRRCNTIDTFGRLGVGHGRGCVLLDDKTVRCWGVTGGGAVFQNPPPIQPIAIQVPGVTARQISMGYRYQCALQDDGTVVCWGNNDYGQLGFQPAGDRPPEAVPNLAPAVEMAVGPGCTCARHADGTVDCWGLQSWGCLGTGTDVQGSNPTPTPIAGVTSAVQIKMNGLGGAPMCARLADGTVKCWYETVKPETINNVNDAVDIAVGFHHVFIKSASKGLLYTTKTDDGLHFRDAAPYVVGDFSAITGSSSFVGKKGNTLVQAPLCGCVQPDPPLPVPGVPAGDVVEIAAGPDAFADEGIQCLRLGGVPIASAVYCWGNDLYGGLGIGAPEYIKSPQDVPGITTAATLFTSQQSTSVVLTDGSVMYWGRANGLIAGGATATPASVALLDFDNVSVTTADIWEEAYVKKQDTSTLFLDQGIPQGTPTNLLSCGADYTTALGFSHFDIGLRSNGTLTVYAKYDDSNLNGIFGNNTDTSTPGQCVDVPGITGATGFAAFGDDYNFDPSHVCAIVPPSGTLKCWGNNYYGQVGNGQGPVGPVLTPNSVAMPPAAGAVVSVAAGWGFTCALGSNSRVYCWGHGEEGQIGLPNVTGATEPFLPVVGITNAVAISARMDHACALLADGTVKCWGSNEFGQIGNGTFTDTFGTGPVTVPGLQNVAEVRAGSDHTCVRRTDHTVACWGSSYYGQVGTGLTGQFPTPTQVQGL